MSAQPSDKVIVHLRKLLWLVIDNPNDHERAVAGTKLGETMKANGLTPDDVLCPPPVNQVVQIVHPSAPATPPPPPPPRTWRVVAEEVWNKCHAGLSEKERAFVRDILTRGWSASERQVAWLAAIASKRGIALWDIAP